MRDPMTSIEKLRQTAEMLREGATEDDAQAEQSELRAAGLRERAQKNRAQADAHDEAATALETRAA